MDMSPISKRLLYILLPAGFTFAVGLGVVTRSFSFVQKNEPADPPQQQTVALSTYRLPDSLNFCGERVPLEVPDVRKRMDWAFYTEFSDGQIILDLKRSAEYFPYIEGRLRDMQMPEDLKYLPVAESALRNVVSSRGAAGIWQFTPESARLYGLIVSSYVDERYNFRKATVASLKYLSDLHAKFGSWTLSAAAYNMGSGGLSENIDYQRSDNYYGLYLNDETSRFVFRILAIKQIMSNYKSYGFELTPEDFYQPADSKLVVVTSISDLSSWARSQGSSYKEVKELNKWIIGRSLPFGTWEVELPKYAQPLLFTSPAIREQQPVQGYDSSASSSTQKQVSYVVKWGDTLDKIAARFGVTARDLIKWNAMTEVQLLKPGQRLEIFIDQQDAQQ